MTTSSYAFRTCGNQPVSWAHLGEDVPVKLLFPRGGLDARVAGARLEESSALERCRELPGLVLAGHDEVAVGPFVFALLQVDDCVHKAGHFLRSDPLLEVNADRLVVELGDERVVGGRAELSRGHECC